MNAVGKLGNLIIEYQFEIEVGLLALLALIILIWLIRMISRAVRRRDVLQEIDSKITDLNEKVNTLNQKQEELISADKAAVENKTAAERPIQAS